MMQETRLVMGMPVCVAICDAAAVAADLEAAFDCFVRADARFSPFRPESELSRLNRRDLLPRDCSVQMCEILALAEQTRIDTGGYFDVRRPDGALDPCGIVKGWAIHEAARSLTRHGMSDFFIDAGGDIQSRGRNAEGGDWRVGIRNPFQTGEIVKVLIPRGAGVATSGSYLRGAHIYNPHAPDGAAGSVVSLTVVGPDILEADRFATAAFAMGEAGIEFIERVQDLEGYQIDAQGMARMTSGLGRYLS
jgi:thiamine biosynthesis lipoprotein